MGKIREEEIVLSPGERLRLVIMCREPTTVPQIPAADPDADEDTVQHCVPYLSQWDPSADLAPGDCGPTCLAMAVQYLTVYEDITVNEVAEAAGMLPGDRYSSFGDLVSAARKYHLEAEFVRPLSQEQIVTALKAGDLVIALVRYGQWDDNQDAGFKGAHFVLVTGATPTEVIFHDPNRLRGGDWGQHRRKNWEDFMQAMGSTSKTAGNSHDYQGVILRA